MNNSLKKLLVILSVLVAVIFLLPAGIASAPEEAKTDLSLYLLPGQYYNEVVPGEVSKLYLEVRNNGDHTVSEIVFSADLPEGWMITFEPDYIDTLGPESVQTIDVNLTPPADADNGDYNIAMIADAAETRAVATTILRVKNGNSIWLWTGIGLAAAVIAGFIVIFIRYNR